MKTPPNLQNMPVGSPKDRETSQAIRRIMAEKMGVYQMPSFTELDARIMAEMFKENKP